MAALTERVDRHDRKLAKIEKVIDQGFRLLMSWERENRAVHAETRKELRELAAAQKRTEATLRDFIASMRRGGNGHKKGFAL